MEYKYLINEQDKTIKVLFEKSIIKKIYTLNNGNAIITTNDLDRDQLDLLSASIQDHLGARIAQISERSLLVERNGDKIFHSEYGDEYIQLFIEKPNLLIFKKIK